MTRLGGEAAPPLPEDLSRAAALELGEVPGVLEALSAAPEAARSLWALLGGTLFAPTGRLPRTTKELVALAAASTARVGPLRRLLRAVLERRGLDARVLDDLEAEGQSPRLPERTQRVLAFGRRAAVQPALLGDADYARLRRLGLGDAELAELIATGAAVAAVIALARALGWTAEAAPDASAPGP